MMQNPASCVQDPKSASRLFQLPDNTWFWHRQALVHRSGIISGRWLCEVTNFNCGRWRITILSHWIQEVYIFILPVSIGVLIALASSMPQSPHVCAGRTPAYPPHASGWEGYQRTQKYWPAMNVGLVSIYMYLHGLVVACSLNVSRPMPCRPNRKTASPLTLNPAPLIQARAALYWPFRCAQH
jgi:hypothetical protein